MAVQLNIRYSFGQVDQGLEIRLLIRSSEYYGTVTGKSVVLALVLHAVFI